MPTWRTTLPPEGKNQGFDLRRTPASGAVHAIITCADLIVCDTHYWHGRTLPCERLTNDEGATIDDTPCQPCREKAAWRTHVYVSAFDAKKREHFLFECTAMAAKPLAEYRDANTSLRGCIFYASRPKGTKNAKVAIETNTANLTKFQLPNAPDIALALAVIWRLPRPAITATPTSHAERTQAGDAVPRGKRLRATPARLTQMRTQPDNQPDPPTIAQILAGNGQELQNEIKT